MKTKQHIETPRFFMGGPAVLTGLLFLAVAALPAFEASAGSSGPSATKSRLPVIEFENVIDAVGVGTHVQGWAWATTRPVM